MTDVIVRPSGPIALGSDRSATIRVVPGGSGANQAAWLSHCGMPTRFAGRVGGADHAWQTELLARAGVESRLAVDDALPTGTVVTLVSPDGERSFLTERGANRNLQPADLPFEFLEGVTLLHISAYALFEPGPREAVLALMAEASRRKIPVSVDPASEACLRQVRPDQFLHWTAGAALCFPNAAEAAVLAGTENVETQLDSLCNHYALVVLKLGAGGARAAAGTQRWHATATAAEVVDTSGAGDAFLGGFLAEYLARADVGESLRAGIACAAMAVAQFGARPASYSDGKSGLSSAMESAV